MQITVKLFATLREGRFAAESREVPAGTTVLNVVQALGVPEKDVALILVNGRHADMNHHLSGGDTLALFPPIGGG